MTRWFRIPLTAAIVVAVVLLVAMAAGGANSTVFERYFPILLIVTSFATIALLAFIGAVVYRLFKQRRNKVFGSRMTINLALYLSLAAVFPCLLLYFVSSQFIGRSIDSWFDVRVEQALDSGVALSSEVLTREQHQLLQTARRIASILNATSKGERALTLDRMRETSDAASAIVFSSSGEILLSSFSPTVTAIIDRPTASQLQKARAEYGIYLLEGEQPESEGSLRIRSIVPMDAYAALQPTTYLQLTQVVPKAMAEHTIDLVEGYRNYQELVLSRTALRNVYTITLTLTMLLAVLVAVAVAFVFASATTAPVLQLARGTRKVAEGDLRPIKEYSGDSEINLLTKSFNTMIFQVADARENVERRRQEAEQARSQLELILANLSSGVLVTDDKLRVAMSNAAAADILHTDEIGAGTMVQDVSPTLAQTFTQKMELTDDDAPISFELPITSTEGHADVTLFVRASRLHLENGPGFVIIFDDITRILDAQRAVAWGEVARRLAHEIKNPLTPIRLAAERLEMKLTGKLDEKNEALLHRTTGTIVTQVDAMKQMVNDFRDFAKLPEAVLKPLNLKLFLAEVVDFYHSAGTEVQLHCDGNLPEIGGDTNQLRQVFHNLISNSVEAIGRNSPDPFICLTAELQMQNGTATGVRVTLTDNGGGFSPSVLAKAFEPYITTKPTGTGLGLPMVKKIMDEHHARISLGNRTEVNGEVIGAKITLVFPLNRRQNADAADNHAPEDHQNANPEDKNVPAEQKVRNIVESPS